MKKRTKSCLSIVLILVALCITGSVAVVIKDICPPLGPWPMPPWCDGSEKPFVINPQAITRNLPAPLTFTVSVPANTPEHTTVYIEFYTKTGENYNNVAMQKTGQNEWVLRDSYFYVHLQEKGTLYYRYSRNMWGYTGAEEFEPDSPDSYRVVSIDDNLEIKDTVRKWRWIPEAGYVQPAANTRIIPFEPRIDGYTFQEGVVFADFWWDIFTPLIPSTNARMQASSINWVQLAPTWDYEQTKPTPIISTKTAPSYPDDRLRFHLEKLQEDGFSIYLEPQVCCTNIYAVEDEVFTPEWWDAWYEQYEYYLLYHVDIANDYGIEYLVVSDDWFVIEKKPEGYEQRLTDIYAAIDERYSGKLGRKIFLGSGNLEEGFQPFYPNVEDMPYMDKWDFIAVNFWAGISDSLDPTPEELDQNVEKIFETRLKPLYTQYGKPLVLNSVAYSSIDGCLMGNVEWDDVAIQMWEPYSTTYTLDLAEQAMGFDAIMRAVAKHNYIIGVYPFFYFPDTFPTSMEFNIRDKPAEEVLSQWYKSIP
jgi:hypothetical protein